ncbi:leucyl/phenylalanyl-tRNA--protein transferase [Yoonia sp. 208BN28-4]|uniref:leucyl/phenylalanyl-tRNA--protein transferase n=1 Tax=Yoonia sp. 208BN28-4 TaxID=3126505 RepID=UPI0030AFD18E
MPKDETPLLTPELLLAAYRSGVFPMSESRDNPDVFWVDPRYRGVMPLDGFHISRSLAKVIRKERFSITFDTAFPEVVAGCADREETWINAPIFALYQTLHRRKTAHSIEVWDQNELVGGVYGVVIGAAFFGESMFSTRRDASKVALAYLVDRLRAGGFMLFDTQFITAHLASLGAIEITRPQYQKLLSRAIAQPAAFHAQGAVPSAQDVLQRNTQTS